MMKNCNATTKLSSIFLSMALIFVIFACENDGIVITQQNHEEFINALPQDVIYPSSNPYSPEKEALGRLLYWDPILSGTKDVACVSCHHPNLGYADGLDFSKGVGATGLGTARSGGFTTRRNAPTVINTAFNGINNEGFYNPELALMFWDNRAESLEGQAFLPMLSKEEMRGEHIREEVIIDTIIHRLNNIP